MTTRRRSARDLLTDEELAELTALEATLDCPKSVIGKHSPDPSRTGRCTWCGRPHPDAEKIPGADI